MRLQQKVTDFCFARQTEKEDLMKQVQQNIVSGKSDAPKNPPPRPPPPTAPGTSFSTPQPQNQPPVLPQHQQYNYVQGILKVNINSLKNIL